MAKNNRNTPNAERSTKRHRCLNHPDRLPAISVQGRDLCWECHLGVEHYRKKFGREADRFYRPGGPGWAGD